MVDAKLHTIKLPYPDKGDRTVWVYVPSHSDGEKLPVVYMTDGQNLFDDNSTPHGSWEVAKAVENEQKSGVGNAVIVGIETVMLGVTASLHRNQSVWFSTLKCSARISNPRAKSLTIFL